MNADIKTLISIIGKQTVQIELQKITIDELVSKISSLEIENKMIKDSVEENKK